MKTKLLATILTLSLFTSILTIATHISPVAAQNTKLYITPPEVQKDPIHFCTTFNVSVMIDDVEDLFGFDIKITWDSSLLTFHKLHNYTLDTIWTSGWFDIWPPSTGAGWIKYVAVGLNPSSFSGSNGELFILEFHVEHGCNFKRETAIHFEAVKLSDSNWTEIEPVDLDDGLYQMSATMPDLEFELVGENLEYCDIFEVEVYVTHICATLKDYDFIILYDDELLEFLDVDYWGVLGDTADQAGCDGSTPGMINVWDTGGKVWSGDRGLLFALTFHVEFDCVYEYIWQDCGLQFLTARVWFQYAQLSFEEGIIEMGEIIMPPTLAITINLIQGDVNCDGQVTVKDLRAVAIYYDESAPIEYDLTCDGTIDIFDLVVIASNYGYGVP